MRLQAGSRIYFFFFFLMDTDIGIEAFESSSCSRQQTSASPPILFSICVFSFAKPLSFHLMVEERLGLVMRNSTGMKTGSDLEPASNDGVWDWLCHFNSLTCSSSTFLSRKSQIYPSFGTPSRLILIYLPDNWRAGFSK